MKSNITPTKPFGSIVPRGNNFQFYPYHKLHTYKTKAKFPTWEKLIYYYHKLHTYKIRDGQKCPRRNIYYYHKLHTYKTETQVSRT